MLALKHAQRLVRGPSEFIVVEYNLIADGVQAFHRGELPKADWPSSKLDGWNMAGMTSYHTAMLQEHDADKVGE